MLAVFIASYIVVLAATPVAIRIARATNFLDRPRGFRSHANPTPYLGGAAVFVGFLAGALVQGTLWDAHLSAVFAGAAVLWLVGTVDDRVALGPRVRVLAEVTVGVLLWNAGLGWSLFPGELADLIVTVLWVVGLVNAFNLMDNLDGAAGAVGAVCAAGIALLTLSQGPEAITALAVAVSAACIGFLHYNLARPPRIFLGDGGSMLVGFLVAALAMAAWRENVMEGVDFLPAIMLAGLPVLDMTLVIVSRKRRGVSVATGGRDHISHRLLAKLGVPWRVALALGLAQGALSLAAIEMMSWDRQAVLTGATVCFLLGVATIALLESHLFRPDYPAKASQAPGTERIRFAAGAGDQGGSQVSMEGTRAGGSESAMGRSVNSTAPTRDGLPRHPVESSPHESNPEQSR